MERPVHGDEERRGGRRAPALEDADRKRAAFGLERDAQGGRRSLVRGFARAEKRHPGRASSRSDREAPQLPVAQAAKPAEDRVAASRAQHLLRGP
jgi:hypothetical protein